MYIFDVTYKLVSSLTKPQKNRFLMNKLIYITTLILLSFALTAQTKINFEKSLKIEHIYGDESYAIEEMKFEIRNGKVYGRITNPNKDALLNSETKLNESEIKILNSFLKLVDKYQNNCQEEFKSSFVQYYTITTDKKEVKIYKFCNWKRLTYFDIKQNIFGEYLKKLEKKKRVLNSDLFTFLNGYWKGNVRFDKVENGPVYKAEKIQNVNSKEEYFEFKRNNKLLLHLNQKTVFYEYRIDILNGEKYLNIYGDGEKNAEEFVYGHRFLIKVLNKNIIELSRT
jgi:hypothetical protein